MFPTLGSGIDHISAEKLDQQCWQLEVTNFSSLRRVMKQKKKEEIQPASVDNHSSGDGSSVNWRQKNRFTQRQTRRDRKKDHRKVFHWPSIITHDSDIYITIEIKHHRFGLSFKSRENMEKTHVHQSGGAMWEKLNFYGKCLHKSLITALKLPMASSAKGVRDL